MDSTTSKAPILDPKQCVEFDLATHRVSNDFVLFYFSLKVLITGKLILNYNVIVGLDVLSHLIARFVKKHFMNR